MSANSFRKTEIVSFKINHSNKIAGLYTRSNAGGVFTDNSGNLKPTIAVSYAFTPTLAQIFALAQALAPTLASASALGLLGRYTDKNLQKTTKLALKSFVKGQKHS